MNANDETRAPNYAGSEGGGSRPRGAQQAPLTEGDKLRAFFDEISTQDDESAAIQRELSDRRHPADLPWWRLP